MSNMRRRIDVFNTSLNTLSTKVGLCFLDEERVERADAAEVYKWGSRTSAQGVAFRQLLTMYNIQAYQQLNRIYHYNLIVFARSPSLSSHHNGEK